MNAITRRLLATIAYLAMFAASAAVLAADPPATTHDGLVLQPKTKAALVYLKPDADFRVYERIALLECGVAFKKDWKREHTGTDPLAVTKKDMDQIRARLAELFAEVFKEELQKNGGYQLVDVAAEDVLVLRPAIIDLDITAPAAAQTAGRDRTFATSAGQMTLYLEFFDSTTGEVLARIADRQAGREMGTMIWQSAATNRAEAERMLRRWAKSLREGLDTLRTTNRVTAPQ
jgi:Protein of unknown function (DUF3313)